MKEITIEDAYVKFPWLKKLDKADVMQLFFDITKMILLNKEEDGKTDIFHALGSIISKKE